MGTSPPRNPEQLKCVFGALPKEGGRSPSTPCGRTGYPPLGKLAFRLGSVKKRMRQIVDASPSSDVSKPRSCNPHAVLVPLDAASSRRDHAFRQRRGCNGTCAPAV